MLLPQGARSQSTVLTRATIAALRNQVRLIRKNQAARAARVADVIAPGDAIATAANSLAELRFNDNSLARLGAQTVFRFNAGTRAVDLSRGTALMLIQPGQGSSTIRTPNAAAGINGSAIFCRYNPETDTTVFGALTDSGIEIFNADGSQRLELKGGQMAVVVAGRIDRVYNMDLDLFYETSPLVQGLDITNPNGETDKRLNPVRSEVNEALERQSPLNGEATIVNPEFVRLPESESEFGDVTATVIDFNFNDYLSRDRTSSNLNLTAIERDRDNIRSILTGGQIQTLPTNNPSFNTNTAFPNSPNRGGSGNVIPDNRGSGGIFPGGDRNNPPGNVNNRGNFPGGGATNGNFPGQGNGNGGNFPGQG
ncbi:MAG: FecR domain-containing protein, partial [Spirulinaceae cyanobacterium]